MDIRVVETNNGGDIVFLGKDFQLTYGLENMPYLAMFGGNVEASTKERLKDEQVMDWWGNNTLLRQNPKQQFNSSTERALNTFALTSSGKIQIENAVKEDLMFMSDFADITVTSSIIATDKIQVTIKLKQPENLQAKEFVFIWDNTKKELLNSPDK